MASAAANTLPAPSAFTTLLTITSAKSPSDALPLEILRNLRHQHSWSDLHFHPSPASGLDLAALDTFLISTSSSTIPPPTLLCPAAVSLLSGIPPQPLYVHPDLQTHLISHNLLPTSLAPQVEFVLPASLGGKWSLRKLAAVFDCLPPRHPIQGVGGYVHLDAKRILLGMISREGKGGGGDGTVVYYLVQEGDVKPRQN